MLALKGSHLGVGELREDLEFILAGQEDLAVFQLDLDDRVGRAAHGDRIVAEVLRGRVVAVDVAVEVDVAGRVERFLDVQDQVHDHAAVAIIGGRSGRDGNLADDLLHAEVDPEHERHVVGQHAVVRGPVGVELLGRHVDQAQQLLVLRGILDLELVVADEDDEAVLFFRSNIGRQDAVDVVDQVVDRGVVGGQGGRDRHVVLALRAGIGVVDPHVKRHVVHHRTAGRQRDSLTCFVIVGEQLLVRGRLRRHAVGARSDPRQADLGGGRRVVTVDREGPFAAEDQPPAT